MIRYRNEICTIDEIEIIRDIEVKMSNYSDDDVNNEFPASAKTIYKVIVKFRSGESSIIESNSLDVASCEENQIAFRQLIAETQAAVEKIKIFITVSKN